MAQNGETSMGNLLSGSDMVAHFNSVVRKLEREPTVEDVHRRCLELMGDDQRTVGAIRAQLISEFGKKLFDEAAVSAR